MGLLACVFAVEGVLEGEKTMAEFVGDGLREFLTVFGEDISEATLTRHFSLQKRSIRRKPLSTIQNEEICPLERTCFGLVRLLKTKHLGAFFEFLVVAPEGLAHKAQQFVLFAGHFPAVVSSHALIHLDIEVNAHGSVDSVEFALDLCFIELGIVDGNEGDFVLLLPIAHHMQLAQDFTFIDRKYIISSSRGDRWQFDAPRPARLIIARWQSRAFRIGGEDQF